jgi:hypothetical protein
MYWKTKKDPELIVETLEFSIQPMVLQPKSSLGLLFLRFLNYTHFYTHGRTPLDE